MQVNEEGKVVSVDGFEEVINAMVDSAGVEGNVRSQLQLSLRDQFNEQAIKDQFAPVFDIFPNKAVKTGDSWQKEYTLAGKMPAAFSTKYSVKSIEGKNILLDAKSVITPAGGGVQLKGDQTGVLLVDGTTGLVLNGDFTMTMETKVQGMEIAITGKGKIKGKER